MNDMHLFVCIDTHHTHLLILLHSPALEEALSYFIYCDHEFALPKGKYRPFILMVHKNSLG